MIKITHANSLCPLWKLNVPEGTQYIPEEGLSVGISHTDQPVAQQIKELDTIRELIVQTCTGCLYHISNLAEGCEPAIIYRGGFVSTVIVNQKGAFPSDQKENSAFYYLEIQ